MPVPFEAAADNVVGTAPKQRVCVTNGCVEIVGSGTTITWATADVTDPQPDPLKVTMQ